MLLAAISLILSIAAILISIFSFRYTKRQTEIMEAQESRRTREAANLKLWEQKFNEAVSAVTKVGPSWIQTKNAQTNAYGIVCPKPELRQRIEAYLVNRQGDHFSARQASSDLLGMSIVQHTITELLECVEHFRQADPGNATKLGL